MPQGAVLSPATAAVANPRRRQHWPLWLLGCAVVLVALAAVGRSLLLRHMQPMLRSRLVNTLGERFGSPVALDRLTVVYQDGFQVDGAGLRVQSVLHGVAGDPLHPMLQVQAFHFRLGLLTALRRSPRIHHVRIRGVQLDLPHLAAQGGAPIRSSHEVRLEYAEVDDVHVRFASAAADRAPLRFDVPHLVLHGVSRSQPIRYRATVDNGAPVGLTETEGTLGPWNFNDPRLTPIEGTVVFQKRDVSSIRGLRGVLSVSAKYRGTVSDMHVEGTSDDPAFGLDMSRDTVALRTRFAFTLHAEEGLVALESLHGSFGHTTFALAGVATKNRDPEGFRLDLQLHAPAARVEDVLTLGTRAAPTARGALAVDGRLCMRAGGESVSRKLSLEGGRFNVQGATFTNGAVQREVDALAARARGNPKLAKSGEAQPVAADMTGAVELADTVVRFRQVHVTVPGAQADVAGTYALQGARFAFDGEVHTAAEVSDMTTGVRSAILKPFNGLLGHNHAKPGATLQLHISGTGDMPHFATRIAGFHVKAPGTH